MDEHQTAHDMIDVTDCLEARDAFRGMKNFSLWIMLLSLLALQGLFWLNRAGGIERDSASAAVASAPVQTETQEAPQQNESAVTPAPAPAAQKENAPAGLPNSIAQEARKVTEETAAQQPAVKQDESKPANPLLDWSKYKLADRYAVLAVSVLNFLVLFMGILYCLTLLITLKVSLVSRLGGVNHISRAFFTSLLLLVLLVPWQTIVPGVLLGTIYLPKELLVTYPEKAASSKFWLVMLYLRFVGMWLLAMWLLLWSGIRSGRWYRATQRRLGIMS